MSDFFFISYSSVDGVDFAVKLADELSAGPPAIPVWLDKRNLRAGEDWDEQVGEAIKTCKGMIFVMSADSVRADSVCKNEWVRALKYKKPVIPLLLARDAELPFRLGSREYINFSGSFDSALARLRKQMAWMDSLEGQLQALKYRLSDAQRELPRSEPEQKVRIREDIADLERQIAQQQKVIDNPKAAEERVQQSIETGLESERKPVQRVGGIVHGKFINPPPLIAPTWFQDRHFETAQIGEFLKDESLRLMTIVGRGGVGKTAMVCRLLRSLEGGQLPDDGGALMVDGIIYLSAARSFHRPNLPDLYAGLTKLLPEDTVKQLDSVYKNPQTTTLATMEALVQAFPRGRTVVLLDNFEDMLAVETGQIKDAELNDAIRALMELPPHGIKMIITTRVAPSDLARVQPGLQRRLDLDQGLEHPFAENILRAMDADGKVGLREAPEALLAEARERTLGYPRALEHLFGILSADRDTSLQEILDNTKQFLPEQVVTVLVGEAFSRLDVTAQRVMQALAVYRYPVPPAAVDYLLQPHVPGIDSGRVLSRLVNMQFARRDAGRYYLHQVDRDYALGRIAEGDPDDWDAETTLLTRFALRHRAADWFRLSRKPREMWKTLGDLAAQLSEFELRCEGNDYNSAAAVLLEFDFDYLNLWGHYRLMTELHERLQGNITDTGLAQNSVDNLGTAYYRMGQLPKAISSYQEALRLAQEHKDRRNEGVSLGNLGVCFSDRGQNRRAIACHEQALEIAREVGNRRGESTQLGNLAILYQEIGQSMRAVDSYEKALLIDRKIASRENEALNLNNLGISYRLLGRTDEALRCHTDALAIARDIGYRLIEAAACNYLGDLHAFLSNWADAERKFELAIEVADDIGNPQISRAARERLALVNVYRNKLTAARELIEAAAKYDVPLSNPNTLVMLGVVALRQRDMNNARKAFTAAINEASQLLALNPDSYDALDVKGLALCGLVLCGETSQIPNAKAAFKAARSITADVGIIRAVLQLFDALGQADTNGILTEVRPLVAGTQSQSFVSAP
ncbi:MAG TPA: tetratricopeptide repeat protein [Candidatus Angelobacter sp.]